MNSNEILIVGAGGHAKVVIDALCAVDTQLKVILADEDERKRGIIVAGHEVISPLMAATGSVGVFHISVGGNAARERICIYLTRHTQAKYIPISHPHASISSSARIGSGVFVAAQAVIGPDAQVGKGCIVNHGAVVDHDCIVDDFSHIAPNATLGGGVRIGRRVLVGAGANILPGVKLDDDCIVGAGAVVLNNLESGSVYAGVPARKFK